MSILHEYVDIWRAQCADLTELARDLSPVDWQLPTDCPGWTVHDVFAHCVALEAELAGDPRPKIHIDVSQEHIVGPANIYTERGVAARHEQTAEELLADFADAADRRSAALALETLDDPGGKPGWTPGGIDWDWETLLRNRVVDLWVHEQDIRRAVHRPGHLDSAGARVTQETFALALPFVVAKRAAATAGTSVVFDISGPVAASYPVVVDPAGRGRGNETAPDRPTLRLTMTTEEFTTLAAGRRTAEALTVTIDGDAVLAQRVLSVMALTV